MNSLELKDKQSVLIQRCQDIVSTCKKEIREMTDEEAKEFEANKAEIISLKEQLAELEKKLESYESEIPTVDGKAEAKSAEEEVVEKVEEEPTEKTEDKELNNRHFEMKKNSIVKEIRSAIENGSKQFKINANTEKRAVVTGDVEIETEIQGILEPLYANSVLTSLGVKWYKGMPMGNVSVPIMGQGNVGWADEIAAANESKNKFSNITLTPKRLTAYVDISKMMIAQDTYGIEEAIRRDIVNALNDKLEATIFGSEPKSETQPAGIFNGVVYKEGDTFAKICANEA